MPVAARDTVQSLRQAPRRESQSICLGFLEQSHALFANLLVIYSCVKKNTPKTLGPILDFGYGSQQLFTI